MPRKLRVEYPGAICHVLNRELFVSTLGQCCGKTGWEFMPIAVARTTCRPRRNAPIGCGLTGCWASMAVTMTLKWVADALHMGAWRHVSNLLSQEPQKRKK